MKQLEELVVRAVAHIALAAAGLQTGSDSVPHISGWSGDDALDELRQSAQMIDALARRIERAIASPRHAGEELELREAK